jgi:hypothetical protein
MDENGSNSLHAAERIKDWALAFWKLVVVIASFFFTMRLDILVVAGSWFIYFSCSASARLDSDRPKNLDVRGRGRFDVKAMGL